MKFPILEIKPRRRRGIYGTFTIFHAKKDGSPFLKTEKSGWWDVNGCMINFMRWNVTLVFKRRNL